MWIDAKTNYLIHHEGVPADQAYATAISMARERGFHIPQRRTSGMDDWGKIHLGTVPVKWPKTGISSPSTRPFSGVSGPIVKWPKHGIASSSTRPFSGHDAGCTCGEHDREHSGVSGPIVKFPKHGIASKKRTAF